MAQQLMGNVAVVTGASKSRHFHRAAPGSRKRCRGRQSPPTLESVYASGRARATDLNGDRIMRCNRPLRHYARRCIQDRPLNEREFLFIDNHFQVLQMAYLRWKHIVLKC